MRVLLVNYEPEAVDFSDPSLALGLDAEKLHQKFALTLEAMQARGWITEQCFVRPDDDAVPTVKRKLASAAFDYLVIGAVLRMWVRHLPVFEAIVNAAREAAPTVPIAFSAKPQDSGEAVERVREAERS